MAQEKRPAEAEWPELLWQLMRQVEELKQRHRVQQARQPAWEAPLVSGAQAFPA